jgi:predicted transcriptional regulator
MTDPRPDVTDAELAVLKLLWERGASTIRELTDQLYPDGAASHYATVQKLLERLERKTYVTHESRGRVNVYSADVAREELVAGRLRDTADRLCEGSLTPLLTQLVGASALSAEERIALRDLVTKLDAEETEG